MITIHTNTLETVFLLCFILGVFLIWRLTRRKRYKSPEVPDPTCGCDHHFSFHDPETKACHGKMTGNPIRFDGYGYPTAHEQVECTCRRYSGPVPLPEYYAPEIGSSS